jgi:hypothetical protein
VFERLCAAPDVVRVLPDGHRASGPLSVAFADLVVPARDEPYIAVRLVATDPGADGVELRTSAAGFAFEAALVVPRRDGLRSYPRRPFLQGVVRPEPASAGPASTLELRVRAESYDRNARVMGATGAGFGALAAAVAITGAAAPLTGAIAVLAGLASASTLVAALVFDGGVRPVRPWFTLLDRFERLAHAIAAGPGPEGVPYRRDG